MLFTRLLFSSLLLVTASGLAAADGKTVMEFLEGEGCVWADTLHTKAADAGLDIAAVEARVTEALDDGLARQDGSWIVLSEAVCTIRLPDIAPPRIVTDLHRDAFTSAPDAYDHPGCFLNGPDLLEHLVETGVEDRNRAQDAYLRFLASGIISGDVRFYSDDALATPPGFQVFGGTCADVPTLPAIRQNHALLVAQFGKVLRAVARQTNCDENIVATLQLETADLPGNTNPWMFIEIRTIAQAAGWFEGLTYTDPGVPRPPLCHYEPL